MALSELAKDSLCGLVSGDAIRELGLPSDSAWTSVLLSDWLLCARGVSTGQVVVGVDVGVRLGVGLGDETGMSLLGLTWNRPTVTIDFFSVEKKNKIKLYLLLL